MDKAQLLGTLNDLVARYETHRGFIDRARAQQASGKFASNVIEKVVKDHSEKASGVADQVRPLVPQLEGLISGLRAEKDTINGTKGTLDEEVQEFELRLAIGELSESDFESAAGALRDRLNAANARIAAIDAELEELGGAFQRWNAVAAASGHGVSTAPAMEAAKAEAPKPEPVKVEAPVEEARPEPVKETKAEARRKAKEEAAAVVAPVPVPEPEPVVEPEPEPEPVAAAIEIDIEEPAPVDIPEPVGPHTARTDIKDDISAIFGGDAKDPGPAVEEDIAIETSEIVEDAADSPSADVQFGFGDEVLGPAGEVEMEIPADSPKPVDEKKEQARRALLLYQEGTADEQIYPFTNDTLTIGRGRENDIQIKADSKVSRYHCKLFRRGNNFYIEDVKSSNGTLVNGDLITDRRLFGGEEIIIGETFFRFRIMD